MNPLVATPQIPRRLGILDKPLLQSTISDEVWRLAGSDLDEFEQRVKGYFALGYPGWTVIDFDFATRTIYLRDDRIQKGRLKK